VISVVLSRPKGWAPLAGLICWGTDFDASHASLHAVGMGLLRGHALVLEAVGSGVALHHSRHWLEHYRVVHKHELQAEHWDAGRDAWSWTADTYLDGKYDFIGLWAFAARVLMKKVGLKPRPVHESSNKLFCSELVARWLDRTLEILGRPALEKRPDDTSPADLIPLMESTGLFEAVVS